MILLGFLLDSNNVTIGWTDVKNEELFQLRAKLLVNPQCTN